MNSGNDVVSQKCHVTVVILTLDEEIHLRRALESVKSFADRCFVVDSGSTDSTIALAKDAGAEVLHNPWINYATQFNWALGQLCTNTQWVLRLDADEFVTTELAAEIAQRLPTVDSCVDGVYVSRRMTFLGRPIRYGGVFPVRVLRLFRHGKGRCENRWMDEHIIVDGATADFSGELLDDNKKPLSWWTEKHNAYASREVVDILNLEHRFMPFETVAGLSSGHQAAVKRWLKEQVYARLPGGARAFAYFIYRYFVRLGFLDGPEGAMFHVLQGFCYRFLVDAKLYEVKKYMRNERADAKIAIRNVLNIDLG